MKAWLERPWWYEISQGILTRRTCWKVFVEHYLRPVSGGRLLDLGCGTGLLLKYLPPLEYYGLDSNPKYILYAKKRNKASARFIRSDLNERPWPVKAPFDRVMATGLLHHLPDSEVVDMMKSVHGLLAPQGKFVTFDGFYEKEQSPIARWLLSHDRGRYVRSREDYEALARSVFKKVDLHIERRLLRLPYSHLIMEMAVG